MMPEPIWIDLLNKDELQPHYLDGLRQENEIPVVGVNLLTEAWEFRNSNRPKSAVYYYGMHVARERNRIK